jgi:hypothetical protein
MTTISNAAERRRAVEHAGRAAELIGERPCLCEIS